MLKIKWEKICLFAGGALLGSYGVKLLTSQDAKKLYTNCTAAVLRMKDEVIRDVATIVENAEDIREDARDINEERRKAYTRKQIEDAKALLANAGEEE